MFLSIPGRKQTVVEIIAFIKAERCSLEKKVFLPNKKLHVYDKFYDCCLSHPVNDSESSD